MLQELYPVPASTHSALNKETLSAFNGTGEVQIEGIITTDPVAKGSFVDFRIAVVRIRTKDGWKPAEGAAQAKARPGRSLIQERSLPYFKYGDRIRIYGELQEPPKFEDFDYRLYLARQGVSSSIIAYSSDLLETNQASPIRSAAYSVRSSLSDALGDSMPSPSPVETGLAKALTLGIRSEITPKLNQAFIDSGTAHVLSVSGLHIAVLVSMMTLVLSKTIGKANRLYFLAPLVFLWVYALITGLSPPVVRSAVMGSIYIWALQSGRQRSGFIALGVAAAVMLAVDPNLMWDVSFQLSFVSMLGLFVLSPPLLELSALLKQRFKMANAGIIQLAGLLLDIVAINLSFMLASVPIIAFNFHSISLATLPASLLTIPALPLILPAIGASAVLGLIWEPLGYLPGWIAWVGLKYLETIVIAFGDMSFAKVDTGNFARAFVAIYYIILLLMVWLLPRFLKGFKQPEIQSEENPPHILQNAWVWCGAFMLTASVFVWNEALNKSDDRLHVKFLDTPGVNAILLQKGARGNVLIDGGSSPSALAEELSSHLSLTNSRIDALIATQQTAQFITGLSPAFSSYKPGNLITAETGDISNLEYAFQTQARVNGVKEHIVFSGAMINGNGITVKVLHPPKDPLIKTGSDIANNSLALRITDGNFSLLSLRGLRPEGMSSLLANNTDLQSTVLSVAWVNERTLPTEELLAAINPALIVFTGPIDGAKRDSLRNALKETLPNAHTAFAPDETNEIISDGARIWLK